MTRQTRKTPPERPPEATPTPPAASQPWLGWAAVILVGILVIIGIALGSEQLNDNKQPVGAEVQITPIVGGMAVPAATSAGEASGEEQSGEPSVVATNSAVVSATGSLSAAEGLSGTESASGTVSAVVSDVTSRTDQVAVAGTPARDATQAQPVATVGPDLVFEPGAVVQNVTGDVTIFAEPNREGQVLDTYAAGMDLTVLEPGGDFTAYPVEIDGTGWVRVRAADGLAGWTPAAGLSVVN